MLEEIKNQIECIDSSLEWIAKYRPGDYDSRFITLVRERRRLRMIASALQDNPGIATYGVSQVGKSYLVNCILQRDGTPFMIEAGNRRYNFIEEMNPKTDNTEATGVVTRFSSFSRNPGLYSREYPIMMKCLSLKDIILILCEGYYNDISDYTTLSDEHIKEAVAGWVKRYRTSPAVATPTITADDMLGMGEYFSRHINNAQAFVRVGFFTNLSLVVEHIPSSELKNVFSKLWNDNEHLNFLFEKMLNTISKFGYSSYVWLPVSALLHNGINANTVMSVQCLGMLLKESNDPNCRTDAYIKRGNELMKVAALSKSEVCAVCAEIIVKIGDEYLECTDRYCLDGITDERVREKLTKGEVTMSLLKDNDLLDFPGARSRKKQSLSTLQEDSILTDVLLRGKVAYLFNMYNESLRINILLYCHHAAQHDVSDVPALLNDWVKTYVGRTMAERADTISATGGIPPFFYIGTKFNMDLKPQAEKIANEDNAMRGRWQQRFEKVLYSQCFNADGSLDDEQKQIFLNWTKPGETFSNSYLLRDYKYSGSGESNLYENERVVGKKTEMLMPPDYYQRLRSTFCESDHVRLFFSFPELSWDVAATADNDGSLYIIENLSKVAGKMSDARETRLSLDYQEVVRKVHKAMQVYFVSTEPAELVKENIRKARSISRELDFTCNSDNWYFGHLLQTLQISEKACYRIVHDVIHEPEINSMVNNFKDYEIIRQTCALNGHPIERAQSRDECLECIVSTYRFENAKEAETYLKDKKVDIDDLLTLSYEKKQNSYVVAGAVFDTWRNRLRSADFFNEVSSEGSFDRVLMGELVENVIGSAIATGLESRMAGSIAPYVNVTNIQTANETMLADMLASLVNDFTTDLGCSLISKQEMENALKICNDENIPVQEYIQDKRKETYSHDELSRMFADKLETNQFLAPPFKGNYYKWMGYMYISFFSHVSLPENYSREANDALGEILDRITIAEA